MAYISFSPKAHFNTKLWTGNSTNSTAITGVGFQPDMVWIKNRSTTDNHAIFDAIRGATYRIYPNATDAQVQATNSLASFDSDGFTLNDGGDANGNGENIVGWNWKAGGAGSANSNGSISSTVSVNNTAGFSIVKWTGTGSNATVGHGLNAAPKLVIVKNYSRAGENWRVGSITGTVQGTGATNFGASAQLDNTGGLNAASNIWNDTAPTSTVFSVGTAQSTNYSGDNLIAYCFKEVPGYSRIGIYQGRNNSDNTFVYTGFKPAFILIKNYGASGHNWQIHDNKRLGYNPKNYQLYASAGLAEDTNHRLDIKSNGFKIVTTGGDNGHVSGYFYFAIAEMPAVGSNNTPALAR
tara:strand:+ start:130 stop:1185 length:1056 start_codon:yes stop_codon:yes gene_type:complete